MCATECQGVSWSAVECSVHHGDASPWEIDVNSRFKEDRIRRRNLRRKHDDGRIKGPPDADSVNQSRLENNKKFSEKSIHNFIR